MATGNAKNDQNFRSSLIAVSADDGETPVRLEADPSTGALLTNVSGTLITEEHDYISVGYPDATSEVYTFKTGGAGGATVAVLTIVYTDSTKDNVSSVTKAQSWD